MKRVQSTSQPSTTQRMSQMIKKSVMRYTRKSTPEERRLGKFTYKTNVQSTDSCEEKTLIGGGDPSGGEGEGEAS